ncbi:MAG: tetratricopeptide repeat protein [Gemmatimonadetes bacterium]|nr:tetratricopeptide repeat protein [Gemmatimonadota bacterium]MBK6778757.1 tetratricopeptide repeat protein [Gemmatimonadota bacterium]MBK7714495.1 tetratricopeptide repeat protein [Gemmatimonadota bacterium]MBK7924502.1 tetratricopeptide repeat protein [Gemmatimonadota bacterium]MBK9691254.1 tetratricopeptide repeat protein [Gemmatimonadota bacterium]
MTEDIRALSAQYAADPSSLVFLRLGEGLRHRGQLDAALKVALAGLNRYPHLPDAHDLYARILADRRDYASAFDEWDTVLRLAPHHIGAHKGIGYLYYRAGEPEHALFHLRTAAELDPGDPGLRSAVERVAGGREIWETPMPGGPAPMAAEPDPRPASTAADPFAGVEGAGQRLLLVDSDGLRLGGALQSPGSGDVSEEAAAALAAVAVEADRAARLLELGEWSYLTVEGTERSACVLCPAADAVLLATMDAGLPAGQLIFYAERGAKSARAWLERVR